MLKYVLAAVVALAPLTLSVGSASAQGPGRPALRQALRQYERDFRRDLRRYDNFRWQQNRFLPAPPRANWYRYDYFRPQGLFLNPRGFGYQGSGFSFWFGR